MSQVKAERLMNLHIMLLGARRFVSKETIRSAHYSDYPRDAKGDAAFERAFERDKDDLRSIGAFIETGSDDPLFDDEIGYRIPTELTSLPQIRFSADEAAVLGLAARAWEQATLAKAAGEALTKLTAAGVDIDPERLDVLAPAIRATEPAFEAFWEATQSRRTATFAYRKTGHAEAERRRLQPWGVVRSSGRWYVVGHDLDRGERRVFRLSRVVGEVKVTGKNFSYEVPEGVDVRAEAERLYPAPEPVDVDVLVRPGAAAALRRRCAESTGTDVGPDGDPWDRLVLRVPAPEATDLALAHGPDVVVLGPEHVRERVLQRVRRALEVGA